MSYFLLLRFLLLFFPTGQGNPGRGWLVLSLFLLLLDFPLPFFIRSPAPPFFAFALVGPFPLFRAILPSYLHVLLFSLMPNNPILDPCHRGLPEVQIDI